MDEARAAPGPRAGDGDWCRQGGAMFSDVTPRTDVRDGPRPSATARLAFAAGCMGVLFAAVLVLPQPLWAGQPVGPPPPGAAAAPGIGLPGALITLVFALALCLPFRPYRLAARAVTSATNATNPTDATNAANATNAVDAADATNPTDASHPSGASDASDASDAGNAVVSTRALLALTALLALVAGLMYPRFGSDVFDYLGFERMWLVYGDNPLLAVPAAHPDDWSTPLVWFAQQPPAYGPLWALLTWPIAHLAGDSALAAVLGYKLLAAVAYAACCRVIWLSVEPARRARALVVFAWSPLVLFEVLGKAHNDVLVALAVLVGVWLARRHAWAASVAVVVAGGLVKATSLVVLPMLLARCERRSLLRATAAGIGLLLLGYAPFWAGAATLQPLLHQTGRLVWSPGTLLVLAFGPHALGPVRLGLALAWVSFGLGLWLGLRPGRGWGWGLGLGLGKVARARRARARASLDADLGAEAEVTVNAAGWLMFASILLLSTAVYAHYLVPLVALGAVASDGGRLERAVTWLSLGALAAYSVELFGLAVGSEWLGSPGYQLAGSLLVSAPLALVLPDLLSTFGWSRRRRPCATDKSRA